MADPAMVFGNPRPSWRELQEGDIIIMELAAGYRGYSAQIGQPICLGEPPADTRRFWDEIALPGYEQMIAGIGPGKPVEGLRTAGRFFRDRGVQSRPIHVHGIDFVSARPPVYTDRIVAGPYEEVMKPAVVIMSEPNPNTTQ